MDRFESDRGRPRLEIHQGRLRLTVYERPGAAHPADIGGMRGVFAATRIGIFRPAAFFHGAGDPSSSAAQAGQQLGICVFLNGKINSSIETGNSSFSSRIAGCMGIGGQHDALSIDLV
jgi:hypothetical protein